MSNLNKITIVTVNYNSSSQASKLITSIEKFIPTLVNEIIVIDNNSQDLINLKYKTQKVKLIKNKTNLGFSKATNIGIQKSKTDLVLLLNPDSFLVDSKIENLVKTISSDKTIGLIGGKICNQKGQESDYTPNTFKLNFFLGLFEFTLFKKLFPNNKITKKFKYKTNKISDVDSLCGAFMLFYKKIEKTNIKFDEKFFLYLEDVDFSIMIKNLGYRIVYYPNCKIHHTGGASSNSVYKIVHKYWYDSRRYFFKKYLNKISFTILDIIFIIEEFFLHILRK